VSASLAGVPPRPQPGTPRPYHFPAVHRHTLPNGVTVVVVPMPRLPIVTAMVYVDAGANADPVGEEGLALLTASSLTEGIVGCEGTQLVERFEQLGTVASVWADWEGSYARLTVLKEKVAPALELLAEVLRAPTFPVREVERLRDQRLAGLAQQLAEPRGLADERFDAFLYAPTMRYARPVRGTQETVPRLTREGVAAFHARHYGPATTMLVLVGDLTPETGVQLATTAFGGWSHAAARGPAVHDMAAASERRIVLVEKPDAPQTELRVGHVGVPRLHPDYLAIVVMNGLLGGFFSSRINLNLREKHAFTYGASSSFEWRRAAGPFTVGTAVKTEVTGRALEEILKEIDAMRAAPPSASELALAADYLAGVFPLRFESTAAVAGTVAMAESLGVPEDFYSTYRERVRALTADEVYAAARTHLHPDRLLVLAVGDTTAVAPMLDGMGIGPVTRVAAEFDPTEGR
jgi:zinc protease